MALVHDDKYYYIGKGKLLLSANETGPWEDMGNCSAVSLAIALEELEHFSARAGLKVRDKLIVTSQKASGKFSCDNITIEHLEKYFMADGITPATQTAGTGLTKTYTDVDLDIWYEIGKRNVSAIVLKNAGETVTYTLDSDFALDLENGLIMFLSTGLILADDDPKITAGDFALTTTKTIASMALTKKEYWAWFVGDPATGEKIDIKGQASLKPDGELALISDEWGKLDFIMEFITNPEIITKGNVE